jgi:two-component system response regulator
MENNNVDILLVEDNLTDAEMTIRALRKGNILNKVVHLKDGEEALDFIFCKGPYHDRDVKNKPKVILLDLKMPKVGGLEVLEQLKANEETRRIPVVVLTSSKEDPDINACYRYGVNSYIVKPVGFENFTRIVGDLGLYWLLLNQSPF